MNNGYDFYFRDGSDVLAFPITPSELTIKVGSTNKVVTLIDEGEINILKSPSLINVEFEARFPMRQYPYAKTKYVAFETYFNKFKELKEQKKSFQFLVARQTPRGSRTWDTDLLVALEDFEINEDAAEGDDVLITFKLKQYKEYGIKRLPSSYLKDTTSTSNTSRGEHKPLGTVLYKIQRGDCLWNIAKVAYSDPSQWRKIYLANKGTIEAVAKDYGKKSSSNGHWIYPGTTITIPDCENPNLIVPKLKY